MSKRVLLVGSGYMAKEYAKVLQNMNVNFDVIGRGKESAEDFQRELNIPVLYGGLEAMFRSLKEFPTHAIIATTLESLEDNAIYLLENGVKNILLEKPGAVTKDGMSRIERLAREKEANVYIAYNRRFYTSVLEAKKRIKNDGGLTSFLFEFTEWGHVIEKLNKTEFQLNHWFIANSTHVLDTAFYFGGKPVDMHSFVQGETSWHPSGCIYVGSGITENHIPFSYHANWNAPGSWKLELLTNQNRYIFRPFEKLHVQKLGSVDILEISIEDQIDIQFKPGIYRQTDAFFNETVLKIELLSIKEANELFYVYSKLE